MLKSSTEAFSSDKLALCDEVRNISNIPPRHYFKLSTKLQKLIVHIILVELNIILASLHIILPATAKNKGRKPINSLKISKFGDWLVE